MSEPALRISRATILGGARDGQRVLVIHMAIDDTQYAEQKLELDACEKLKAGVEEIIAWIKEE